MSEFKGTKGEWKITGVNLFDNLKGFIQIGTKDLRWLAEVKGSHVGARTEEEIKANATLIAHAPRMLEMLKDNLAYMEELAMLITSENWTEEFRDNWNAKTNALEQLLQQATTIK